MATQINEMLESCNGDFKAGYFYTFGYNAATKMRSDATPIIYCVYAPPDSLNFTGINFHYFNETINVHILTEMQKTGFIFDDDKQHIFNGVQLHKCFSNIGFGLREYNKSRIAGRCFRIRNKYLPEFMHLPSNFFMTNDEEKQIEQSVELNKNKGF